MISLNLLKIKAICKNLNKKHWFKKNLFFFLLIIIKNKKMTPEERGKYFEA